MKHGRLEIAVLCAAVLASGLAPSFPSTPASRAACPMAGCVKDTGESLGPLMPCCCDGKSLPAAGDSSAPIAARSHSLHAPGPPIVTPPSSFPGSTPASELAARIADQVPLYLRHASLLI
ncbi:MAG: hypothetical protein HY049_12380 [Acidobacteria bacterium]|nr:hypothetical protein [Acidobacteriota bacterium]